MIGYNHLGKNGRFGNQMFQYAALRGIAAKHGYDWCIPPGPLTDEEFVDEEDQHKLFMAFKLPSVKFIKLLPAPYRKESSFTFDQDLFDNCQDNINLYGYFQTEKYFKHIDNQIRQDFIWRDDVWNMCKDIFDQIIPNKQAISLHIRRSDYLVKSEFHPVLPLSYYNNALEKLDKDLPVLVFSDDPKWCNEQEFFSDDRFLISEGGDNITDMCMMSMCNYHIIANSTFSWWGAWLSGSDNVIAPNLWFGVNGEDPKDIKVDRWEYLNV